MHNVPNYIKDMVPRKKRLGAALVLVLAAVVLVMIAAMGFLASVTLERQASAVYSQGVEARVLADSVVNIVMGQIRQASEQEGVVWTSQPGLLRTFSGAGTPGPVYKLYSSAQPIEPGATFDPADDLPADWSSTPESYVDLNRPVVTRFNGGAYTNYPILDPRGEGKIEGFSLPGASGASNRAAMPVAWLYLLKDGSLTNATGMTESNPPVARFAYWTDDETCKLNINTASEGVFWDIPRTGASEDYRMALNQPAQREYQAYPGHPATTSLSPVLWNFFHEKHPAMTRTNSATSTNTFPEALYAALPKYVGGGSRGGTVKLTDEYGYALPMQTEPLLASVDELMFLPADGTPGPRAINPNFDRDTIEQSRFFLTAYNRAPELNLFNEPRVTIWPEAAATGPHDRTPYDNLIAFASTINGKPYYFTRSYSQSTTADLQGSPRNTQLYKYLQDLTDQSVPGFGGDFLTKYGDDRNQILTEIFDYVRCVNLLDTSSGDPNFNTYTLWPSAVTWQGHDGMKLEPGVGQVVPIIPTSGPAAGTRGFGRFPTISRVLLQIIAKTVTEDVNGVETPVEKLEAGLFFEYFNPSVGQVPYTPDYEIEVETVSPFEVSTIVNSATNSVAFSFSGSTENLVYSSRIGSSNSGGYEGFAPQMAQTVQRINSNKPVYRKPPGIPVIYANVTYPFITDAFVLPKADEDPMLHLKGGTVRVTMSVGAQTVQTFVFAFPSQELVVPYPTPAVRTFKKGLREGEMEKPGYAGRFEYPESFGDGRDNKHGLASHWIREGDVVRSLEPTGGNIQGDMRLLMAQGFPENTDVFQPVTGYLDSAQRRFSALGSTKEATTPRIFSENPLSVAESNGNLGFGRLVEDAKSENINSTAAVTTSLLPPGINGVENTDGGAGDWDTGPGTTPNGPFINKSDDGDAPTMDYSVPYISDNHWSLPPGTTFSSPSRQMPSAVMFGSLPTGVKAGDPWQTLLFNPVPASHFGTPAVAHKGEDAPHDHLLLDLFHIPVVEPYAISEPFSTAGKVNMNYQIIPFTGIERKTALRGVMQAVQLTAISDAMSGNYHYKKYVGANNPWNFRYPLNIEETLKAFDQRFASGKVFKSASEICDIPLIPDPTQPSLKARPWTDPVTAANLDDFWEMHPETGDNVREQPYAVLYPRLTTRSNTYTVHLIVQTLKKVPGTPPDLWVEDRDKVTGEFRGSFLIERYLDPSDPDIPDYASGETGNLNEFYRFRVVNVREFNP